MTCVNAATGESGADEIPGDGVIAILDRAERTARRGAGLPTAGDLRERSACGTETERGPGRYHATFGHGDDCQIERCQ